MRRQHGVFVIEPYADTAQAVESLAEYLETNDLGAVWEYPDPGDSMLLVLFSARATRWQHLEQRPLPVSQSRLHVAILNKVMGYYLENAPPMPAQSTTVERKPEPPQMKAELSRPQLRRPTSDHLSTHPRGLTEPLAPMTTVSATREHTSSLQTQMSAGRRHSISFGGYMDRTPSTPLMGRQLSFSANFDEMISGLDKTQKKPRVFISFANSHPAESKAVQEWLSQHISARYIFTDDQENDWEEFRAEIISQPGVLLFYDRYPCYSDLPYLYKSLRPASLFCYNLSFSQSGDYNTTTRLFPRGTVLCITEDTMLNHSEVARSALKWFEENSIKKEQYWKLVLPPDVTSWILLRANASEGETQER